VQGKKNNIERQEKKIFKKIEIQLLTIELHFLFSSFSFRLKYLLHSYRYYVVDRQGTFERLLKAHWKTRFSILMERILVRLI
jgi:hypothetical protein